ncbi:MAG: hypothetical protein PQJ59_09550 [Spirochaetales bacterium]|nr:hypothetical protein [Spirochaetales bacterium]
MKKMILLAIFSLPFLTGCPWDRPDYGTLAERLGELEGDDVSEERIDQLKSDIRRVDREIDETVEKVRNRGTYYKLLGLKYMDYEMWSEGAEAFDGAIQVYPENSRLHYYRAVCLAQSGVNESHVARRRELLEAAEFDYLRAVEQDRIYTSPLWGLAVLYVYEMDRASEGADVLDRLLKIEPSNEKATFLRAELYRETGNKMAALELYRKLIVDGKNNDIKEEAELRAAQLGG